MEVILKKDVATLGRKGQLVKVKPGYFRNYLLPSGLAQFATPKLIKAAEDLEAKLERERAEKIKNAEKLKEKLDNSEITLIKKLTEKGTLYAKVSASEIADAIADQLKLEIQSDDVQLKQPIKKVGRYKVDLQLAPEVASTISLEIESEE